MAIVVHGFFSGLTHTDEQSRPPGLSTRANSAVALLMSGKNMYPKRTETLSNVASLNGKSSALHTFVSILATPCVRLVARQCPASPRRDRSARSVPSATVARCSDRLTRARGNVEMLLIFSDVETLDHRRADRTQLIRDDRVPLLPARGEPGPRLLAERLGSRLRSASTLLRGYRSSPVIRDVLSGAGLGVVVVLLAVVVPAQESEVVEVGGAAVFPVPDVVGFAGAGGSVAAGGGAVPIPGDEGEP